MHRRYFVKYKHWNGNETVVSTHVLGRFYAQEFAERRAQERYNVSGREVLSVRAESDSEILRHKTFRFIIRSLRISFAVALAVIVFLFFGEFDPRIREIPLGDLTLGIIFSALFRAMLLAAAGWLCWVIAFGDGPRDDR